MDIRCKSKGQPFTNVLKLLERPNFEEKNRNHLSEAKSIVSSGGMMI